MIMKTKKESGTLKKEAETQNIKTAELSDEQMNNVSGGWGEEFNSNDSDDNANTVSPLPELPSYDPPPIFPSPVKDNDKDHKDKDKDDKKDKNDKKDKRKLT